MSCTCVDALIGQTVCQLLSEASRQVREFTDLIAKAAAALEMGRRGDALRFVEEAGIRLGSVHLLADEVWDWGLDDTTGIISTQAQAIINALAVTDADYRQRLEELM